MTNQNDSSKQELLKDPEKMQRAIGQACQANIGVLDSQFLCRSVSVLNPADPVCVKPESTLGSVVELLKKKRMGCVLVCGADEKILGIFSERDFLMKVHGQVQNLDAVPIKDYMTKEPMVVRPDDPIAYALNLMSAGGFRHVPVVDPDLMPIGIISVRDVVDFIVERFSADLLGDELGTI